MKKIIIGNNKDTKTLAVELAIKCNIPVVIVPKGTLVCDGMCKVEATINAKEQCIWCGTIHKE